MIYWKSGKFWLGKLKEHPEIMTQGKTLKELEENLRDAYQMMLMEDVPENYQEKALAVEEYLKLKKKEDLMELMGNYPTFDLTLDDLKKMRDDR